MGDAPQVEQPPQETSTRETQTSVALFFATLLSVFLVYGFLWTTGNPLTDGDTAGKAASFAGTLMAILLAHEMGHWVVARRHGFALSLPYFIPFPAAFGTFGAVIRLRSLPKSRTALLEMGAAGPLAGFAVALLAMVVGLPGTGPGPEIVLPEVPPQAMEWPSGLSALQPLLDYIAPPVPAGHVQVLIFANPPIMDLLGQLLLGAPPGRLDELTPVALAGWVGCLLTAMNLLPIGQLDGGHILAGLWPRRATLISKLLLGVVLAAGLAWSAWAVWGTLLLVFKGYRNLEVPAEPPLTSRAKLVLGLVLVAFALSFMPIPLEMAALPASPS